MLLKLFNQDGPGYLAMDESIRPGFSEINYEVEVESDADEATLEKIKQSAV